MTAIRLAQRIGKAKTANRQVRAGSARTGKLFIHVLPFGNLRAGGQ